jgi:xanthine dehydrogenase large subunit
MILDDIARTLGLDPLAVRRANFYGVSERNVTPYGQLVEDNIIDELVNQLAQERRLGRAPRRRRCLQRRPARC